MEHGIRKRLEVILPVLLAERLRPLHQGQTVLGHRCRDLSTEMEHDITERLEVVLPVLLTERVRPLHQGLELIDRRFIDLAELVKSRGRDDEPDGNDAKLVDFCNYLKGRIDTLYDEMHEMRGEIMGEDTQASGHSDDDEDDYDDDQGSVPECVPVVAVGCGSSGLARTPCRRDSLGSRPADRQIGTRTHRWGPTSVPPRGSTPPIARR